MSKQFRIAIPLTVLLLAGNAHATIWTKTIDAGTYNGSAGTISFDDWGYIGPNGRTWNDTSAVNGFGGIAEGNALDPTGGIGQIQHVVTNEHDWKTPDSTSNLYKDLSYDPQNNANMDAGVNFYQWGYTSPGGSTFSNMRIDYDGDYLVSKDDMAFNFYNYFDYRDETTADPNDPNDFTRYNTKLAFQPYALGDATGWCGSVMQTNPQAFSPMAGTLKFDFAMDVYFQTDLGGGNFLYTYMSTEIVNDFQMQSFGDITVDVTTSGGDLQQYSARAVVNNTSPESNNNIVNGAPTDPAYQNLVSFMGADVLKSAGQCGEVSAGWLAGDRGPGAKKYSSLIPDAADQASCVAAGGEWQSHAFGGYAFILRADGIRVLEAMDYSQYPDLSDVVTVIDGVAYTTDEFGNSVPIADLSAVPVPAAMWLFGSGLMALIGFSRRSRKINP